MKQKFKIPLYTFSILALFVCLYFLNDYSYNNIKKIKYEKINHPELLPKKELAPFTTFWFSNLKADIYWLEAIQYIWWNAIWSEYKKYLYQMIDIITDLNPYFAKPYLIWQLLLPSYNERYENLTKEEQNLYIKQAEKLWLKWIKNFCEKEKIEKIKNEDNLTKVWNDTSLENPCKTYEIPFSLAFIYYFYLKNPIQSANFYKIASANKDSVEWAKIMSAIMSWKWWKREISVYMFLALAESKQEKQDEVCKSLIKNFYQLANYIFKEKNKITKEIIIELERLTNNELKFNKDEEIKNAINESCKNYLQKVIREFNLAYIEQEYNKNKEKIDKLNLKTYFVQVLYEKWFLEYLPKDFQQYDTYWIDYFYNDETWFFDYKMRNY